MSFSTYTEDAVLNHVFGTGSLPAPAAVRYVALHSADPTDAGTANELPSTNNYVRASASFGISSGGAIANTTPARFANTGSASWPTATHFSVWDAITAGNCLGSNALVGSRTVAVGQTATFHSGSLVVTLD